MKKIALIVFISIVSLSCSPDNEQQLSVQTFEFDFNESQHNWEVDFVDYPAKEEDSLDYELEFGIRELPPVLNQSRKALMVSGINHSDDLFMFLKKRITGLKPSTFYTLAYDIEFASDAAKGSVGIGGSPAESVYLKVGASTIEPKKVIEDSTYRLNIDKGNQVQDGEDMVLLGDVSNSSNTNEYSLTSRNNSNQYYDNAFVATTNSKGELWLIVGTDSGFEGKTTLYYTYIGVILTVSE